MMLNIARIFVCVHVRARMTKHSEVKMLQPHKANRVKWNFLSSRSRWETTKPETQHAGVCVFVCVLSKLVDTVDAAFGLKHRISRSCTGGEKPSE